MHNPHLDRAKISWFAEGNKNQGFCIHPMNTHMQKAKIIVSTDKRFLK
jgi:hypothetical protein